MIGVLADQNTVPAEAVFADFFGIPAATSSGIARLARRTAAMVVPAYTYWDPQIGKYRLSYEPALELARVRTDNEARIGPASGCNTDRLHGLPVEGGPFPLALGGRALNPAEYNRLAIGIYEALNRLRRKGTIERIGQGWKTARWRLAGER